MQLLVIDSFIYHMEHRIRVAAIIVDDNKLLLVKHVHPETGFEWWVPPGGGIEERDNSIFDCAKREVFEEVNLRVDVPRVVYIREFLDKENKQLNIEIFTLVDKYYGEISLKNVDGNGPDDRFIKKIKWFSKEDLKNIIVFPEILKADFWDDNAKGFPSIKYLGRQVG
jgi:8-oxo-dGTP diphosphatase